MAYLRLTLAVVVIMMASSVYGLNLTEFMTAFLPVSDHIENEACRRDSLAILQGVNNFELWALKMVDSSAKLPSGVLEGNIKLIGHYDECVEAVSSEAASFTGQYCLASVHLNPLAGAKQHVTTLLDVATSGRRKFESRERIPNKPVPDFISSLSLIQLGVCVPSTCLPRDVEVAVSEGLQGLARSMGLAVSIEVPQGYCSSLQPKPFDAAEILMLVTFGLLLLLTVVGTAFHLRIGEQTQTSKLKRAVLAFSVPRNWSRLVKMDPLPAGSFTTVDGIRTLSTVWVIFSHIGILVAVAPYANSSKLAECLEDTGYITFASFPVVDTFFMFSGMMRAHVLLWQLNRNSFSFFSDAWQRYLRLTPPIAAMILCYMALLPRLGNGPMWPKYVEESSVACRKNWLPGITYTSIYLNNNYYCMDHNWYLDVDMLFYLLAPLLIVPIYRRPKLAAPLFLGSSGIAIAYAFFYLLNTGVLPTVLIGLENYKIMEYIYNVHYRPLFRVTAYIVGLAFGCITAKIDFSKFKLSKVAAVCGWAITICLFSGIFVIPHHLRNGNYPIGAALYGSLYHIAWTLGIAWIVFACHTGYGGWMNSFLSARVFQPARRLSYCIFLTHFAELIFWLGRLRVSSFEKHYNTIRYVTSDTVLTLICSLVLHLLVEAPSQELIRIAYSKAAPAAAVTSKSGHDKAAKTQDKNIKHE